MNDEFIKKKNRGVSLVEILVAIAVSAIVMSAIGVLLTQGMHGYVRQTTQAELQNEANIAMNQITDSLMEANGINISIDENSVTFKHLYAETLSSSTELQKYQFDKTNRVLNLVEDGGGASQKTTSICCKYVDSFQVSYLKSSFKMGNVTIDPTKGAVSYFVEAYEPLQVKVTLKLSAAGYEREISRIVNIRKRPDQLEDDWFIRLNGFGIIYNGNGDTMCKTVSELTLAGVVVD